MITNIPAGWTLVLPKITEDMHVAAVKVLHRASGVDGLPQRMLDAMLAAAPTPPVDAVPGEPVAQDFETWWERWPFPTHKSPQTKAAAHHAWRAGNRARDVVCTHCNGSGDDCDGDGEGGGGPWCEHCNGTGAAPVAPRAGEDRP